MAPSRIDDPMAFGAESSTYGCTLGKPVTFRQTSETPVAWKGTEIKEEQYLMILTDEERTEIEHEAMRYIASEAPIGLISPTSFPLPVLGRRLAEARQRLTRGLGFFVLRGFSPEKYDNQMNIVICVGLSSYISTQRAVQYPGGPALTHVVDLSSEEDRKEHQGKWVGSGNQNLYLPFHTDNGHILCLYSIHSVIHGGRSRLASSQKIIDTLREERPDLIEVLSEDWEWDTFSSDRPIGKARPLLHEDCGRTILNFSRRPLIGLPDFPRRKGLTPLTDIQVEALNVLEHLANRYALSFRFRTGDMQFVNNLALLHGREAFRCQEVLGCRRHLLRMFLKDEVDNRPLPTKLDEVFQQLYKHNAVEEVFPWSIAPLPYILSP